MTKKQKRLYNRIVGSIMVLFKCNQKDARELADDFLHLKTTKLMADIGSKLSR